MERRQLLQGVGFAISGGMVSLAGCSGLTGGGGPDGEVVENEMSDTFTVESHRIENKQVLGTDAVGVTATIQNTSDSTAEAHLDVRLLDGDTVVAHDDYTVNESIEPGSSKEVSENHEGRVKDVTRYEISIFEEARS